MKFDLLFLTQNSKNIMQVGGRLLFIIHYFYSCYKEIQNSQIFSHSVHEN